MKRRARPSMAMELMELIHDNYLNNHRCRYRRGVNSYREGLTLAITSRMEFAQNDIKTMLEAYMHYTPKSVIHRFYALAVQNANWSACESFEHLWDMEPFLIKRKRAYPGVEFNWKGYWLTCTNLLRGGKYPYSTPDRLIAVVYEGWIPNPVSIGGQYFSCKIARRFTLTREDLLYASFERPPNSRPNEELARIQDEIDQDAFRGDREA